MSFGTYLTCEVLLLLPGCVLCPRVVLSARARKVTNLWPIMREIHTFAWLPRLGAKVMPLFLLLVACVCGLLVICPNFCCVQHGILCLWKSHLIVGVVLFGAGGAAPVLLSAIV